MTNREKAIWLYRWDLWARPKQLPPPGNWRVWLILSGRGFGKTRTGAEWVRSKAAGLPGSNGALVARTAADIRDVMVEGESGILSISPPWFMPEYEPSKRRLTWPNGTTATTYSAEQPASLRGPQHHWAWADEAASWSDATEQPGTGKDTTWDMMQFGLRLGEQPQVVVTTTPKPVHLIRLLLAAPNVVVTRGSSRENRANLSPVWYSEVISPYEGTRLGRQEIEGELLEDTPGALWTTATLDTLRVLSAPALLRVAIGVDPQAGDGETSAETGIIAVGLGTNRHLYVLEDCTIRGTPAVWAGAAVAAYNRHQADVIVAEINNGGAMVEHTITSVQERYGLKARVIQVHASRGKRTRAEPISALYERQMAHHVGFFPELESQMTTWVPDQNMVSPDRMDAMVWGATELTQGAVPGKSVAAPSKGAASAYGGLGVGQSGYSRVVGR